MRISIGHASHPTVFLPVYHPLVSMGDLLQEYILPENFRHVKNLLRILVRLLTETYILGTIET